MSEISSFLGGVPEIPRRRRTRGPSISAVFIFVGWHSRRWFVPALISPWQEDPPRAGQQIRASPFRVFAELEMAPVLPVIARALGPHLSEASEGGVSVATTVPDTRASAAATELDSDASESISLEFVSPRGTSIAMPSEPEEPEPSVQREQPLVAAAPTSRSRSRSSHHLRVIRVRSSGQLPCLPISGSVDPAPLDSTSVSGWTPESPILRIRSPGRPVPPSLPPRAVLDDDTPGSSTSPASAGPPARIQSPDLTLPPSFRWSPPLPPSLSGVPEIAEAAVDIARQVPEGSRAGVIAQGEWTDPTAVGDATVEVDMFAPEDPDDESNFRMNGSCMPGNFGADPSAFREPRRHGPRIPALLLPAPEAEATSFPRSSAELAFAAGSVAGIGASFRAQSTRREQSTTIEISGDPRGLERGWNHASNRIAEIARAGVTFYIGITENPARRWSEHAERGLWTWMEVLVTAPSSRATGELEERLVRRFGGNFMCQNIGRGGEGRSAGRPHHLYVVVGQSGLIRRSR